MSISSECILLGDIGATNARFALFANGVLGAVTSFEVAKFARFADVIAIFLKDRCREFRVKRALLAIAGPVKGERSILTNSSWVIDTPELRATFKLEARIFNDFEAVALSLPWLTPTDLAPIGGGNPAAGAPKAVVGPGSGLGVACLIPRSEKPVVISSEGGHAHWQPHANERIVSLGNCGNALGTSLPNEWFRGWAWKTFTRRLPHWME